MKNVFALAITSMVLPLSVFADKANDNKLEETVTIASRIEVPLRQVATSVSVVTNKDIEQLGYQSITDILRTLPSIDATNTGGLGKPSSLRIRGEEGYRTIIMIDGVEISDPTGTQVGPQIQHIMTANDIERIEVLRGPQGFIYGADAGGVINLFTQQSESKLKGNITTEYGRFNSKKMTSYIAAGNDSVDTFISAARQETDGFNARKNDINNEKDGYKNTVLHGKLGWNINNNLRAQFVVRDTNADNEFDGCSTTEFMPPNQCDSTFDQRIGKLSLAYKTDTVRQSFSASRTDIERNSLTEGIETFSAEGNIEKFDYLGSLSFAGNTLNFIYGADYETETIEQTRDDNDRSQLGLFTEIQANIIDDLTLTAGIRHDDNDDFGNHNSIRVSAAYIQSVRHGDIKYRTSYGTGFRAPSLSEIAYNNSSAAFGIAAQTTLQEEQSSGYDIGFDYYMDNGLVIGLGYFNQKIDDEIFFDLIDFSGYLQSDDNTESKGYEFYLDYPVNDLWNITANFTHNKTETDSGLQRIRRPKNSANIGNNLHFFDERLKISIHYRIARDAENELFGTGRVALDDYEVLSITANYALLKNLDITLRGENITDEDYEEVTAFNTAGESFYAGLRFSF